MKKYFDQLDSQSRRWVLGTAVVVFVILNYMLVWPHFSDWGRNNLRIAAAEKKIATYRTELARKPYYETAIRRLQMYSIVLLSSRTRRGGRRLTASTP